MHRRAILGTGPFALGTVSLLLFVGSSAIGLLAAYNRTVAAAQFANLLFGVGLVILLGWLGANHGRAVMPVALLLTTLMVAVTGFIWRIEPVAASLEEALLVILPLAIGYGITLIPQQPRWAWVVGLGLLSLAAGLLIAAREMSAGLALLAAGGVATLLQMHLRRSLFVVTAMAVVGLFAYVAAMAVPDLLPGWLPAPFPARFKLFHAFWGVIADYRFTGSGLLNASMIYSTYLFLLHVPFLYQAHNLFLELAVEQGIPGLVGYGGLLVASLWAGRLALDVGLKRWQPCAAMVCGAVVALVVNGLFDAELYISPLAALLFVPSAAAAGLYACAVAGAVDELARAGDARPFSSPWAGVAGLTPLLLVVALFATPGGLAQLYANAGAVAQSQAELSVYHWPAWAFQDQVRRDRRVVLAPAIAHYRTALALDPANVTANWRLGQIALAFGDYAAARQYLATAHAHAPDRRAVRQLLGELYALDGQHEMAVELWRPLDLAQDQLQLRTWWYVSIGEAAQAQRLEEAVSLYEHLHCCE